MPLASRYPRSYIRPPRIAAGEPWKRCGVCRLAWPADMVQEDLDGMERCPNHLDNATTATGSALLREAGAAEIERITLSLTPFLSQAPLFMHVPASVAFLSNALGADVDSHTPLRMTRELPAALEIHGINFSTRDTITYDVGITNDAAPVITATLVTLVIVASALMARGDYGFYYNSTRFDRVFKVR